MITRRRASVFIGASALTLAGRGWARRPFDAPPSGDGLRRAPPSRTGVDPDAVLAFLDDCAARGFELDSFMLHRAGAVAAEGWWWPYRPSLVHMLHSATKSFTGTGVGIAIDEGLLTLDDPVLRFFPGRVDRPRANLQAMRVRHLLSQTAGHAIGISGSQWRPLATSWVDEFFKVPVPYAPGTHFAYSSATSYMLSAIVGEVARRPLAEYLRRRLFAPLAMRGPRWDVGPDGINPGGNGLSTTTADFLKLGILHLHGGEWNGRRIVSREWIAAASRPQGAPDYGFQWWLGPNAECYYAAGKFGQFCFVFPALDAVFAFTAGVPDDAATREALHSLVFRHVPLMVDRRAGAAADDRTLRERAAGLRLLAPLRTGASPLRAKLADRVWRCDANADGVRTIGLSFVGDECRFTMTDERGAHVVRNGVGSWREGETTITGGYLHHEYEPARMRVVAGVRWLASDRLELTWQFVESGFRDVVVLTFADAAGDLVRFDRRVNVNSGPLARPAIVARTA